MTLMIELIGEQYLPNVLPVRHYHPADVLLVYTTRTRPQYERLRQFLQSETNVEGVETEAYNIAAIIKQIDTALQNYRCPSKGQRDKVDLFFNLTGGTKSMVLGAYQLAAQSHEPICYLQSEGSQSVIHYYDWDNNDQLQQQTKENLPEYLTLREMLNLALGNDSWKENGPSNGVGGLFESAIANVLRCDPSYEVMCGIKAYKNLEIDVVVRYQNQLGIIEAKIDGKAKKLDGIQQLATAVHQLGTYTKQFFVINDNSSDETQKVIREASRIVLIPLLNYARGMTSLTAEDVELLTSTLIKSLKS